MRVNVRVGLSMGLYPRVLTLLIMLRRVALIVPAVLSAHVPEMRITGGMVPEKDTGGER